MNRLLHAHLEQPGRRHQQGAQNDEMSDMVLVSLPVADLPCGWRDIPSRELL